MGSIPDTSSEGGLATGSAAHAKFSNIIDIRSDTACIELKKLIHEGLTPTDGTEKTLPTLLLYDEKGLKLFEQITYLDEYYLTGQEIEILENHADQIAERIPEGAMVVELGSGNLRKIKILLDAIDRAGKAVTYYALDLMHSELCFGLWGTYDDGLEWLKRPENSPKPKIILSMGSSVGNFTRNDAVDFIRQFADVLQPADTLLIGIDQCQNPDAVYHAYNDKHGITHAFIRNGLAHANHLLGSEAFCLDDWEIQGEYDERGGRHRAFVKPKKQLYVDGISIQKGERIRIEESYKYSGAQSSRLWSEAGVMELMVWTNETPTCTGSYGLHLLCKPTKMFANSPEQYAAHPVPSLDEWRALWATWDKVTRQMIPDEELLDKPIKLRNACIFYLGHIPTFFDMKLVEATGAKPTEPVYFQKIFERGIDPDVDNPEQCHDHSEIPDSWPDLHTILDYQRSVRKRVHDMYKYGEAYSSNWTGRALWLGFEHEVMHLETLLYMLVQSDKTLAPKGVAQPEFDQIAAKAREDSVPNTWFNIPAQTVEIGLDDPDTSDGAVRYYGWDVEKPAMTVKVPPFKAQARPITNGEYARYLQDTGNDTPASWTTLPPINSVNGVNGHLNGDAAFYEFIDTKAVRTVYGAVPLKYALDWPVAASYDELQGCAQYMGGRIPTFEEARSIYEYAASLKEREISKVLGKTIPAVNGHLVNEGVEESPPFTKTAGPDPKKFHVDLAAANVGFKHWHPMPVTPDGHKLAGHGEMGGLWEWTSSPLKRREGFEPMKLYPAYSADFYDDKHNIVLGGSWATHPRFAGRKSVVNWYQRNYPYVWAGARLVKDS